MFCFFPADECFRELVHLECKSCGRFIILLLSVGVNANIVIITVLDVKEYLVELGLCSVFTS